MISREVEIAPRKSNSRWNASPRGSGGAAAAMAAGRYAAKVLSLLIYVDSLSWIFAA